MLALFEFSSSPGLVNMATAASTQIFTRLWNHRAGRKPWQTNKYLHSSSSPFWLAFSGVSSDASFFIFQISACRRTSLAPHSWRQEVPLQNLWRQSLVSVYAVLIFFNIWLICFDLKFHDAIPKHDLEFTWFWIYVYKFRRNLTTECQYSCGMLSIKQLNIIILKYNIWGMCNTRVQ